MTITALIRDPIAFGSIAGASGERLVVVSLGFGR
jgi:hypothetical protein